MYYNYFKFHTTPLYSLLFCLATNCSSNTRPLSLTESIAIGGTVGIAEVMFPGQLLTYAMNTAIEKKSFVLKESYRGFSANALGQMPITALQKMVQVKGVAWLQSKQETRLTDWQKAGVSFAAGISGALIDTPSNAVQLYLQNAHHAGKPMTRAFRELGSRSLRGFLPNALLKEGPFAVGYQILAPKAKDVLLPYLDDNLAATVLGGAMAGVTTAIVTQPGAVMRNKLQNDLDGSSYKSSWQTAKKIYAEEGVTGFFRGLPQRGTRVAIAVPLYVAYTNLLEDVVKE